MALHKLLLCWPHVHGRKRQSTASCLSVCPVFYDVNAAMNTQQCSDAASVCFGPSVREPSLVGVSPNVPAKMKIGRQAVISDKYVTDNEA